MDWRTFLRWWGEQLADCVPPRVREWLAGQRTVLQVHREAQGDRLVLKHGHTEQSLGLAAEMDRATLATQLAEQGTPQQIDLILPADRYLVRTTDLPLAAANDLPQAIGFQIETLTPFRRDQLWLYCGEQQRLPDGKRLRAWLVAVPRRLGDTLQHLGVDLAPTTPRGPRRRPDDGASITLGFHPVRANGGRLPLGWVLVGLNLLALTLAAGLHLDNREDELAVLKSQARALQARAIVASDLAREAEHWQQRLDELRALHGTQPAGVAVLEELSRRLDEHTWVQRLEVRQQQLRLQGVSGNASALIRTLDESPLLSEVRFEAALTRDPRDGGERFNLSGRIAVPEATP